MPVGSLFSQKPGGSLFNQPSNLFGGASAPGGSTFQKPAEKAAENDNDDEDGYYVPDEEEPPSVALNDDVQTSSPFKKWFEKAIDKFKIAHPPELKKNLGNGKVAIQSLEVDGERKMDKIIFRNCIGKIQFEGNITAKHSKQKRVTEKVSKNQLKVALVVLDPGTKAPSVQHCLINFQRAADLEEFEAEFAKSAKGEKS